MARNLNVVKMNKKDREMISKAVNTMFLQLNHWPQYRTTSKGLRVKIAMTDSQGRWSVTKIKTKRG